MDIRTMQYYLAVVREGTISGAAEALHVAQPSLSRQMKELEEELGVTLFERGNRKITLTEQGMLLRKRAEEMVQLMQITREEVSLHSSHISGAVRIGAGESYSFHYLSRAAGDIIQEYPDIHFEITSGDTQDLMDQLKNGLLDAALIFTDYDHKLYQSIALPGEDKFIALMRKDCPLAKKKAVKLEDLKDYPLIISRAALPLFQERADLSSMKITATYNLVYNASLMVEDGLGIAVTFDKLINTTGDSNLCAKPLLPEVKNTGYLIWKKYEAFSPAFQVFIEELKREITIATEEAA